MPNKFYCNKCRKYKGIPRQKHQIGDQVNITVKGGRGGAYNLVCIVESIDIRGVLTVQGPTREYRCSGEDATPVGTPTPLNYLEHGKCWCPIEETEADSGVSHE